MIVGKTKVKMFQNRCLACLVQIVINLPFLFLLRTCLLLYTNTPTITVRTIMTTKAAITTPSFQLSFNCCSIEPYCSPPPSAQ